MRNSESEQNRGAEIEAGDAGGAAAAEAGIRVGLGRGAGWICG